MLGESVVISMRPDPEPENSLFFRRSVHTDSAVVETHPDGPDVVDSLEVKRRMLLIRLEKGKFLVGNPADMGRQVVVERPEIRTGEMI